jgi:hypothetical protein
MIDVARQADAEIDEPTLLSTHPAAFYDSICFNELWKGVQPT